MSIRHIMPMTLIASIVAAQTLVMGVEFAYAQTDPPALWQPTDSPGNYTVLRAESLFNAEATLISGEYWSFDADAHSGMQSARCIATQWLTPMVRFKRTDVTWADELWLWCKPETEQSCTFTFASWRGKTSPYVQTIQPEWTLVRIPIAGIDAGNGAFDSISDLYIRAGVNQPVLIDDVWAVKLGPAAEEPPPVEEIWGQYRPVRVVWESVSSLGRRRQFEQVIEVNLLSSTEPEVQP